MIRNYKQTRAVFCTMALSVAPNACWACRGKILHMVSFAEPQLLEDMVVVVQSAEDGGKIREICSGDEELHVCSRFGIDIQHVVRLEARRLCCACDRRWSWSTNLLPRLTGFWWWTGRRVSMSWLHRFTCSCTTGRLQH